MLRLVALLLVLSNARPASSQGDGRGLKLLHMQGCTGCHSLDGRDGVGPTLAGRMGGAAQVVEGGVERSIPFDLAYVARSLRSPNEALAKGYPSGVMPAYVLTDEQLASIGAALSTLPAREHARPWSRYPAGLAALVAVAVLVRWARRRARLTRAR